MSAQKKRRLAKKSLAMVPPPEPLPSVPPPPMAMDQGLDLLNQVFNELSLRDEAVMAAKVAGGMARIHFLNARAANLVAEVERLKAAAAPPAAPEGPAKNGAKRKRQLDIEDELARKPPAPEASPAG